MLIRIEKPDQELEGVEPFQSRIGSNSFGAKVACCFEGWIRVLLTLLFDPNFKSNITTQYISEITWLQKLAAVIPSWCQQVFYYIVLSATVFRTKIT